MTGLDRLRELADGVAEWRTLYHITTPEYDKKHDLWSRYQGPTIRGTLYDIADQIEREHNIADREEHDAATWVREHGGLAEVMAKWDGHVPRRHVELMTRTHRERRERLKRHAASLERKLAERRDEVRELRRELDDRGRRGSELFDAYNALRVGLCSLLGGDLNEMLDKDRGQLLETVGRRLMPEGVEWPRFEDGEPVGFGDEWKLKTGGDGNVGSVTLRDDGFALNASWFDKGERVKRAEPKVLDADGVEIRVGDDLYSVEGSLKLHVGCIDTRNGKIATSEMFAIDKWADPAMYTHRAPVLAADGKTLREGETVYSQIGTEFAVVAVEDAEHVRLHLKASESDSGTVTASFPASRLTHERRDRWERLEEDASKSSCEYFEQSHGCGQCPHHPTSCQNDKARDLVRRAKAMAERGR